VSDIYAYNDWSRHHPQQREGATMAATKHLAIEKSILQLISLFFSLPWPVIQSFFLASLLIFFTTDLSAQESATEPIATDQKIDPSVVPVEEKPKPQQAETRSSAMTATGDSAAGSIGGIKAPESAKVSSGGAATQSIVIVVPPGRAGVQPRLSFNYGSQGENSLLGVGWSIGGLPIIHRCPKTVAQDGVRGGVNYGWDDRYCLDGQRLMVISGNYGAHGAEYRTEIDSFLKIVSNNAQGNGPEHFKVWTKGGEMMEFGVTQDSRIEAEGKSSVRVWALNKLQDVKGNYLTITYAEDSGNGEYRPTQIDYTGNTAGGLVPTRQVVFEYNAPFNPRTDQIPLWVGGSKILTTKLLTSVKTYAPPPGSSIPVLVRDYQLEYETGLSTKRSRLTAIRECDGDGNCLPANSPGSQAAWQMTYQEGGDNSFTYGQFDINGSQIDSLKVWTGDFNNDGKLDIASKNNTSMWVHLSDGAGNFIPVETPVDSYKFDGTRLWTGDLNGDGRTDFATFNNGRIWTYLAKADDSGHFEAPIEYNTEAWQIEPLYVWVADINGDGRMDLVSRKNGQLHTHLSNLSGTTGNFSYLASSAIPDYQIDRDHVWPGDYNGDGKQDLLSFKNGDLWALLSDGAGGYTAVNTTVYGANFNASQAWSGDFNSDGLMDIASLVNGSLNTYLSKGNGSFADKVATSPGSYTFDNIYTWAIDVNGDGKTDLVSHKNGQLHAHYSKGNGTYWAVSTQLSDYQFDRSKVWLGDFTGDGKGDLLSFKNSKLHTHSANIIDATNMLPDLAVFIQNIFGGGTSIVYNPLTKPLPDNPTIPFYTKDPGSPCPPTENPCSSTMHLQHPLYVVSNLAVTNGIGSSYDHSYTYGGARLHHLGRGNLGFRWMAEVDSSADARTTTFYRQFFPHTGLPDTIEIDRNSDAAPFRDTIHDYYNLNAYPTTAPTVTFVGPSQVDIVEWDGNTGLSRTLRRQFTYDSAATGNLASVYHHGDINVSGDEREEVTEWIPVDPTSWLHRAKTLKLKDGQGNVLREKWLFYDGNNTNHGVLGGAGLLTKEESNAGGGMGYPDNPVFIYGYEEPFGIRNFIKDPRLCETTTSYETSKTFPQTVAVCSNIPTLNFVTTYDYDARFGVVISRTDPYRQGDSPVPTTTSEYDGFGRLTKSTGPLDSGSTYGSESRFYPDWGNPSLQRVITYLTEEHGTGNVLWSEEYFDGLGRNDKIRREGPDTSSTGKSIVTDRLFDSRDLTIQQSAPYFADTGGTPLESVKYDYFTYDPLGRSSQVTHPDSTFATKLYERGVVTLIDERQKITKRHFDGLEQLIKVQEYSGSDIWDTIYTRDASGALKVVTNALGHLTKIDYDMLGRKRAMCDPNMGTPFNVGSCTYLDPPAGAWTYTYNPAGDLLTQTDAKSHTLTFTYDELGRPKTKKEGITTITSWTYDDATVMHSKGRVTRVVDRPATQNTITNFSYDVLGRVTESQRVLMGQTYTMSQTYDALGRIATETFPAPDYETVTYIYNEAGWLKRVPGYIDNADIQYDARGQKTSLTYANNLTTTWTYDPNRFWLSTRTTSGNQQNLTYVHDPVGNVTSISDAIFTASRTFTYDDRSRLQTASGTFGPGQSNKQCGPASNLISYNAIGNILVKCGVNLTYAAPGNLRPSAVTSIDGPNAKSYTYDLNGNMETRGSQTLTWDIDNRVTRVAISGGLATNMEYDYSGMRVKKDAPAGITLYPFKGYEIDPNGTITKYIRIGTETFASKKKPTVGEPTQFFYHNDHLGGINVITDITGTRRQLNEYDPWGGVSRSEGQTPGSPPTVDLTHRFTGQELDPETGLYYYGGRYYDAESGRFISPDPFVQAPEEPQNLNRYTYVLNNPVNLVDPNGHFFWIPAVVWVVIEAAMAILPELFIAGETLTTLGTIATAAQGVAGLASIAMLPEQIKQLAELNKQGETRSADTQKQNNVQQARPKQRL
jgi:RHS repeat-associated protein